MLSERVITEWGKVSFYLEENKYITNEEARKITGIVQRDKMTQILKNWVRKLGQAWTFDTDYPSFGVCKRNKI